MTVNTSDQPTWLNIGCGPHRAPEPWINLDCVSNDTIRPDLVVEAQFPTALFQTGSVERIYVGHVLEHIPWDEVYDFLDEVNQSMKPGGQIMVVGPDVRLAIEQYKAGVLDWETTVAAMEGSHSSLTEGTPSWPNARHHWNCHQSRLVFVMSRIFVTVKPVIMAPGNFQHWPVVSFAPWQCAVLAVKS